MYIEKPTGGNFQLVPAGNHVAVCYRFIDLGTQLVEWKGVQKTQHKVLISWELPNELISEGDYAGQPFTIGKKYTWSMSEKATLRQDLESWRGKAFSEEDFTGPSRFNVRNIIGKACMLSVVHETRDGHTYANIKGIAAMPKGVPSPEGMQTHVYLALQADVFDPAVLETLSDKLKETITGSPEYKEIIDGVKHDRKAADPGLDDEVPF